MEILEKINKYFDLPEGFIFGRWMTYDQPHRYYHNQKHIATMLQGLTESHDDMVLGLAILYHDIVYDPKQTDNEIQSAATFLYDFSDKRYDSFSNEVYDAILKTKYHSYNLPLKTLADKLNYLDLQVLNGSMAEFIEYERGIFKEYQFVPFKEYREKRVELLKSFNVSDEKIDYVKTYEPTIGVYAGSFNPFHKGHLNILRKAEKIFDKVIIARGVNPKKEITERYPMPDCLQYHQLENYYGLLTDFLISLGYPTTLIRGLRNTTDVHAELTQYRYLQDLLPSINVVTIFCDSEYEHISSSDIRALKQYNTGEQYLCE